MSDVIMYVRWDSEAGEIIGVPSNAPGTEPDWVRCEMPPPRTSRSQTLAWSLETDANGDPVLIGGWVGSSDPSDAPASTQEIRDAWLAIMQYPVTANDGNVFDFDRDSRDLMDGAIVALAAAGGTVDWRLLDNTTVSVNAVSLQAYYDELKINQAIRGLTVDQEYMAYKTNGATRGEIATWKSSHWPG